MQLWGRNGFDGIESALKRRAGFRAPVKRSETKNCQYAVCIRCLIRQAAAPAGEPALRLVSVIHAG